MTVRTTINYWRAAGLTPDEAMAGLGVRRPLACTWAEVEVVAEMRERGLAVEREVAERPQKSHRPATAARRTFGKVAA